MCCAVTSVKSLEEKRGTPLPGISSVNDTKPKSKKVTKIQKADKLEVSERQPTPLPSIQTSSDASVEMDKISIPKCPVILVMGV